MNPIMLIDRSRLGKQAVPKHFGFFIVPKFPLVPYSTAIEVLRIANRIQGATLYTWETITSDGAPVTAGCGLEVTPKRSMKDSVTSFSAIFVCGGLSIRDSWTPAIAVWLKALANISIPLGALSTGSYLLAKSGLLDGYRCAIHWDRLATTREEFPELLFSNAIYEVDRDRYTCAGGITTIDLMLHLVGLDHGKALSIAISNQLLVDRMRCSLDLQRIPLRHEMGTSQPKLTEVVTLMSANLDELLSIDELASYVEISRRQLERLFKRYLNCTPTQYYVRLRLRTARRLLMQSEKPIIEISISCGFATAGHFSKCYKDEYGLSPRADRKRDNQQN